MQRKCWRVNMRRKTQRNQKNAQLSKQSHGQSTPNWRCDDGQLLGCITFSASADVPIWQELIGIKRTHNISTNRMGKVLPTKDATTAICLNVENSEQVLLCQYGKTHIGIKRTLNQSHGQSTPYRRCDDGKSLEYTKFSAIADLSIWEELIGFKRRVNIPNDRTGKVLPTEGGMTAKCLNAQNSAQVLMCQYGKNTQRCTKQSHMQSTPNWRCDDGKQLEWASADVSIWEARTKYFKLKMRWRQPASC